MRKLALLIVALGAAAPSTAAARVETESAYTKTQAYSAALRYLRVDLAYDVTEKDPEAAYLLFKFSPEGRKSSTSGSIEIVERREGIRLVVHLPELPRYHEQVLSEGLLRKLQTEYGDPPKREEPPRPKDGDKGDKKEKTDGSPADG